MLISLLGLAAIQAAQPATLSSHDPRTIADYLQAEGFKAKLDKGSDGDPVIRSGAGGSNFSIIFYNCTDHQKCADLQFVSGYDTDDGKGPTLETINGWNVSQRFGQAYLDKDKDPGLSMDVLFNKGLMSREAFAEHIDTWVATMGRFEKHIGW